MSKPKRILIVDDDELNRELLKYLVETHGHKSETARNGTEALDKVKLDIDLVLMDAVMPGMDGFETVQQIRNDLKHNDLPIIMVTALSDKDSRLLAVQSGANDYITKPVDKVELKIRMAPLLKMKEARDAVKQHEMELEEKVEERTRQLRHALEESVNATRRIREAYLETIQRLLIAAEYKDEDTANHLKRMGSYSTLLAESLHLPSNEVEIIHLASPMHDVGKMGTPDNILFKPARHTPEEREIMQKHSVYGGHILHGSSSELIHAGEIIALTHHEKWDGSGYPKGLAGEEIPMWGRICAVADDFDALTNKRPYKEAFSNEKSLQIMKEGSGKNYEPKIIDTFMENLDKVFVIQEKYRDE